MATLDIRPHSRRVSGWAVAGLSVIALGAFAEGLAHQLRRDQAAPFPSPQGPPLRTDLAAAATPAPMLPTPLVEPRRHVAVSEDADAAAAAVDSAAADAIAPALQTPEASPPAAPPAPDAAPPPTPPVEEAPH